MKRILCFFGIHKWVNQGWLDWMYHKSERLVFECDRCGEIKGGIMDIKEIEAKVIAITAEQMIVKKEDIDLKTTFVEDLGMDSLDAVELTMALEEEFKVEIPDEDAEKLLTVGGVVEYLRDKLSKKK